MQQKVKHEQPMVRGARPQGAPDVTEFTTYRPSTQAQLIGLGRPFRQRRGALLAAWLL